MDYFQLWEISPSPVLFVFKSLVRFCWIHLLAGIFGKILPCRCPFEPGAALSILDHCLEHSFQARFLSGGLFSRPQYFAKCHFLLRSMMSRFSPSLLLWIIPADDQRSLELTSFWINFICWLLYVPFKGNSHAERRWFLLGRIPILSSSSSSSLSSHDPL